MAIVLRSVKGSPLTISEVDGNFTTLDTGKLDKTGGTSLYLGTGANSTRFPNALTVISNTAVGIQQNEPHNAGLISEGTGSSLTTTISGTSGATSITVGSTAGIIIGQLITGTGIAPDATVTNIVGTTITVSFANTSAVSGTGTFSNIGVGVYGVGYTAGAARSGGVVGEGHVSATGDTASAIGVRGYAHDTHAGGLNIGLYGDAANGSSSYALYLNRGNIYSAAAQSWTLNGNLTFSGAYSVTIPTLSLTNALPIASGGTGATSAAAALTALGAYASSNPSGYTTNTGTVTGVGGTAPISSSGGTAPTISISQSGSGSNGYLSSTDWNTFNNKQGAIGTISGLAKGNGANALTSAVAGTDYLAAVTPGASGNVLTSNGTTWTSASAPAAGGSLTAVASGSIANGDVVYLNADGTVSSVSSNNLSNGSSVSPNSAIYDFPIGSCYDTVNQKLVVFTRSSTYDIRCYIGTVSGTSITFGTAVALFTLPSGIYICDIPAIYDSVNGKILFTYGNGTNAYTIIGTVSGTTISFGTPILAISGISTYKPSVCYDSVNAKLFVSWTGSQNSAKVYVGTVTATTITFGLVNTLSGTYKFRNATPKMIFDTKNNKLVIMNIDGSNIWACVASISGTTLTFGSFTTLFAYNSTSNTPSFSVAIYNPIQGNIVFSFDACPTSDYSNVINTYLLVGTVSGTTIGFGNLLKVDIQANVLFNDLQYSSSNDMIYAFGGVYTGETNINYFPITVTDTSVSVGTKVATGVTTPFSSYYYASSIGSGKVSFLGQSISGSNTATISILRLPSFDVKNVIGISSSVYTTGQTVTILSTSSIATNQSGLYTGKRYYINETTGAVQMTSTSIYLGIATAATKLLIGV